MTTTLSHIAKPSDSRCPWLQVHTTPDRVLAINPANVDGAKDLPGFKLRNGSDVELPAWDVLFDVEAMHHKKNRGWRHLLGIVVPNGDGLKLRWFSIVMEVKTAIKAAGASHLMGGSGPNAAMLRAARWILEGETDEGRMSRVAIVDESSK